MSFNPSPNDPGLGSSTVLAYANAPVVGGTPSIKYVADPSGVWPNGTVFGNAGTPPGAGASYGYQGLGTPNGVYGAGPNYNHAFVGAGGVGSDLTKSLQGRFGFAQFFGRTPDDSAQASNDTVLMKDPTIYGGAAYTQTKPVTAHEAGVQIEANVTVSGAGAYTLGQRTIILAGSSMQAPSYGHKVVATTSNNSGPATYGAMQSWRGYYDQFHNPAGMTFDVNESLHGVNKITGEQGLALDRTGYGGFLHAYLHGTGGGSPALLLLQTPSPTNGTTTINDGGLTLGSNLMTTATVPSAAWIGRVVTNANLPAGTQVLNWYGTGPYTVVLTANATATVGAQTVTITEPDTQGIRIVQGLGALSPLFSTWASGATNANMLISRTGNVQSTSGYTVFDATMATALVSLNTAGYKVNSATLEATGAGTPALGANSPATVLTAPYKWLKAQTSDGTNVFIPAWK